MAIQAVQADLEFLLQLRQYACAQRLHGPRLAGGTVLGDSHAARIVEQHGDDVFLGLQLSNNDSRLPEEYENECYQERFEQPDNAGLPGLELVCSERQTRA